MTERTVTRRELLRRCGTLVVTAAAGSSILSACGGSGGLDCTDTSGLDASQRTQRTSLQYVERSRFRDKNCANCSLYESAAENQCGGCTLVPGPINPAGYCAGWVANPA
ncbi:MAG: high-potential iron-sulfur protein [Myxococcota bacterium]